MRKVRSEVVPPIMALAVVVALAACAGSEPEPQASETATFEGKQPSGFVAMEEVQVAYIGSAGGGDGTLTYQGQSHPFKIGGLGVGGVGVSTIDAHGEVYNLTDLKQFPGDYVEGRYGAVAGTECVGDLWLRNEKNVVLHLKAKREGLMLSVGADVIDIDMSE
jgi:hypothetical protein